MYIMLIIIIMRDIHLSDNKLNGFYAKEHSVLDTFQ